jgi:hypothetical protein
MKIDFKKGAELCQAQAQVCLPAKEQFNQTAESQT